MRLRFIRNPSIKSSFLLQLPKPGGVFKFASTPKIHKTKILKQKTMRLIPTFKVVLVAVVEIGLLQFCYSSCGVDSCFIFSILHPTKPRYSFFISCAFLALFYSFFMFYLCVYLNSLTLNISVKGHVFLEKTP